MCSFVFSETRLMNNLYPEPVSTLNVADAPLPGTYQLSGAAVYTVSSILSAEPSKYNSLVVLEPNSIEKNVELTNFALSLTLTLGIGMNKPSSTSVDVEPSLDPNPAKT